MITAFTTTSSNATLPVNIECCNKMGAEPEISSFVLPLGATINMDGTAIYQAVCAVFIACCYGVQLTLGDMAMIVLTATLASVGTAGVSGAGMIMLAMVLTQVGLPVEGIAIIAGVDKLFDMGRTTLNITGDATCALFISRLEREKAAKKGCQGRKITTSPHPHTTPHQKPAARRAFAMSVRAPTSSVSRKSKASPSRGGGSARSRDGEVAANLIQPLSQPAADSSPGRGAFLAAAG